MYRIALLATVITLSGCATTVYNKPGATQAQLDQDIAACQYKLQTVGDGVPWPHLLQGCMLYEKGWTLAKK
ncbi:hypothetical protein [Azospirillum sp. sgz301742]